MQIVQGGLQFDQPRLQVGNFPVRGTQFTRGREHSLGTPGDAHRQLVDLGLGTIEICGQIIDLVHEAALVMRSHVMFHAVHDRGRTRAFRHCQCWQRAFECVGGCAYGFNFQTPIRRKRDTEIGWNRGGAVETERHGAGFLCRIDVYRRWTDQ